MKDTAKSVTGVQTPTTSMTPQVTPEKTPDKTPDKTPSRDKGASFVVEPRGPTPPPAGSPPPPLPKKGTNTKQRKQTDPRVSQYLSATHHAWNDNSAHSPTDGTIRSATVECVYAVASYCNDDRVAQCPTRPTSTTGLSSSFSEAAVGRLHQLGLK